ncbi:hypothetical protein HDU83_003075 [Entophlyctis luteolus]|nr:hypothetical protein HDU82_003901 [Entophlyctis luteolus]KAJ3346462.1 hypothetical protein HDU83_003075 [Entophlyctis luteolus]
MSLLALSSELVQDVFAWLRIEDRPFQYAAVCSHVRDALATEGFVRLSLMRNGALPITFDEKSDGSSSDSGDSESEYDDNCGNAGGIQGTNSGAGVPSASQLQHKKHSEEVVIIGATAADRAWFTWTYSPEHQREYARVRFASAACVDFGASTQSDPDRATALRNRLNPHRTLGITGRIPALLFDVPHGLAACLRVLDLSSNSLRGAIPPQVGICIHLERLCLGLNLLTGKIPETIGSLTKLRQLDLSNNWLEGPIPHEIGKLTKLIELRLDCNRLTGKIPRTFGRLVELEVLNLKDNGLIGAAPKELRRLKKLRMFRLSNTYVYGVPIMHMNFAEDGNLNLLTRYDTTLVCPLI